MGSSSVQNELVGSFTVDVNRSKDQRILTTGEPEMDALCYGAPS